MKMQYIAISMVIILALLFILTPIFRRKEIENSKKEVKYFELLKSYKNSKDKDLLDELKNLAKSIYNLNDDDSTLRVESDLKFMEL